MTSGRDIPHAGIVLAGGRSSRMGTDKAGIAWQDSTLLARVVGALAPVCGEVVVVRAPGQVLPPLPADVRTAEDAHPDRGPLEGMLAGLRAIAPGTIAFVCAVDAPFLGPRFVGDVLAAVEPGSDAAVPRVAGRAQPLAAAYRREVAGEVEALLAAGGRSMGALLERLEVRWLDDLPGAAEAVRNLNTPAALERARQESREKCTTEPAPPSSASPTQASAVAPASEVTA